MLVALLVGLGVAAATPARAHAELESTDPKDGASLTNAPDEVSMEFGEDLLAEAVRVVASSADGTEVPLPDPVVDANEATVAWPAEAPAGSYTVSFRVVSQDGHPITGSFTFSYERSAGEPSEPSSSASTTAEPSGSPSASGSADPPASSAASPAAEATPSTSPVAAADQASGASPGVVVGIAVVALAVLVGLVLWMSRRGRTGTGAGAGG
jgi:methionine-rich copper-binding protein CopC